MNLPDAIIGYSAETLPAQSAGRIFGIYAIRNSATGSFYIGSSDHVVRRWRAHISQLRRGVHHSIKLQWAWKRRGEAAFEFLLLEQHENSESLVRRETELLEKFAPKYNTAEAADNPMRGKRHSSASILKMSIARKGKGTGRPRVFTATHRANMSASAKARGLPIHLQCKRSKEADAKMAATLKHRYAAGTLKPRTRPVEINGIIYPSGRAAAEAIGIQQSHLVRKIKLGFGRYCDDASAPPPKPLVQYVPPTGGDHSGARAIIIDDIEFPSITEAAKHFGRRASTLNYWLQRGRAKYADGGAPPPLRDIYSPR